MQSMNNKVKLLLIDRVYRPLILMVAATAIGLVFLFCMLAVVVVAPFAPVKAKAMFYKLTEGFI